MGNSVPVEPSQTKVHSAVAMGIETSLAGVGVCDQDSSTRDTYVATEVYHRRDGMKPRPLKCSEEINGGGTVFVLCNVRV